MHRVTQSIKIRVDDSTVDTVITALYHHGYHFGQRHSRKSAMKNKPDFPRFIITYCDRQFCILPYGCDGLFEDSRAEEMTFDQLMTSSFKVLNWRRNGYRNTAPFIPADHYTPLNQAQ